MRGVLASGLLAAALAACGDGSGTRAAPTADSYGGPDDRGVPAEDGALPDFLLVTIDTLRADYTSPYGHPADPTPFLGRLARTGAVFDRHYAVMAHTAPSHASMFTGLMPTQHALMKNGQVLSPDAHLLAEELQAAGYRTGAFVGATVLKGERGFARGFEVYDEEFVLDDEHAVGLRQYMRSASEVVDRAMAFLAEGDGRPTFLWVHVYDPHDPYEAPEEFNASLESVRQHWGDKIEPSERHDRKEIVRGVAKYEGEVRYVDVQIERLLGLWDQHASGREGLVIVTADHGEGLGQHQLMGHGLWNYEEQLLVPLLVRMPGRIPAGARVGGPTSHVDLASTVAELLGLAPNFPGNSLLALVDGDELPGGRPALAERRLLTDADWERRNGIRELVESFGSGAGSGKRELIALVRGDYKYIWSEDAPDELYDLSTDPGEHRSLLTERPDLAEDLRRFLTGWRAVAQAGAIEAVAQELDPETLAELEALGY